MNSSEIIAAMLSGARRGDIKTASLVIDYFGKLVESGEPVPPDMLEYIAQILSNARWDPDHAARHLGIKARGPGKRGRLFKPVSRDIKLAWLVKYEMHAGATLDVAVETVAKLVPRKETTVKNAYLRMLPSFEKKPNDYDNRTRREMYLALLNNRKITEIIKVPQVNH